MSIYSRISLRSCALLLASIALLLCTGATQGQDSEREPIAFIGHGAIFDRNGAEVAPTAAFIRDAQSWYRNFLIAKLNKDQRAQFDGFESTLTKGLKLDEQSQLVANAYSIDWLIKTANPQDRGRLQGKNNLMKFLLQVKLEEKPDVRKLRAFEVFKLNPELIKRLIEARVILFSGSGSGGGGGGGSKSADVIPTGASGQQYRDDCVAQGVPLPPDIGNPGWVDRGAIPQAELFIVAGLQAEVMTYESTSPVGMCIALPRFDASNNVALDGIICMGKLSSKVCYFDNAKWPNPPNGGTFTYNRYTPANTPPTLTPKAFTLWGGGTEIAADNGAMGGNCSDCHAGENPYIIHGTVLNSLAGILPTFPDQWYQPRVPIDSPPWPINPGPMNAPPSCVGCHVQGNAGRFPHISTDMPGYCDSVLTKSINLTMPPWGPGTLAGTLEMNNLLAWCGQPPDNNPSARGDPHITTSNGVTYDFQSAGEFTLLRDADGLLVQTRQTPVGTSTTPLANAYTGLTSCVSLNTAFAARVGKHRVTYEPNVSGVPDPSGMQLRVDGVLTTIGGSGLNLPGGGRIVNVTTGAGYEIIFPDQTHIIVSANWWPDQSKWYLNVDVVNTPGREGVMGTVLPGNWLPLLPNGSTLGPKPSAGDLHTRFVQLNQTFTNAWRVTATTSLFDYKPGTSTATFTNTNWPVENPQTCAIPESRIPPAKPMDPRKAQVYCRDVADKSAKAQCLFDVTITGEPGFARSYLISQQLLARKPDKTDRSDRPDKGDRR